MEEDGHQATTRSEIRQTVNRLKSILDKRSAELISKLDEIEATENNRTGEDKQPSSEIHFTWEQSLEDACSCFGDVCITSVSASESTVSGGGVTNAVVDEAAVVNVQLFNSDGTRCNKRLGSTNLNRQSQQQILKQRFNKSILVLMEQNFFLKTSRNRMQ